jgi:hypothetical protein
VDGFLRADGAPTLLDGKLLIASLNRGGLAGSSWELDDPVTGATPASCHAWRMDGAKLLMRVDEREPASLKTMLECAQAINQSNALALPMFLEPLPVTKTEKGYVVVKTAEVLTRLAGVASALGDSSRYLWLKLPHCDNYEAVARATTLPILLLGGESAGDPAPFLRQLGSAMAAGSNVRGALVGRNVLYPGEEDPLAMAQAAGGIIHEGWSVDSALESMAENRGRDMDRLSRWLIGDRCYENASHDDGPGAGVLPEEPVCRAGWRTARILCRSAGDFWAWECGRNRAGSAAEPELSLYTGA